MKEVVLAQNNSDEFYTDEKCFIIETSNSVNDPDLSIVRARVEPGVTTRWHRLKNTVERYAIISGEGIVEVGDAPAQLVNPGDVVVIPEMVAQRIRNTGKTDLLFFAICSPRFTDDVYEDIEHLFGQ